MKLLVFVSLYVCISQTEAAATTEAKTKMPMKIANSIPMHQKQEFFYPQQQTSQHAQNFIPVQLVQKPVLVAPQQPHTMLIIAQPAYVPQSLLYGSNPGGMQQLLNYFHSHPQAKYQLLYGGYQPHTAAAAAHSYIPAHNPVAAQTAAAYQVVANPIYNQLVSAPAQIAYAPQPQALPAAQVGAQYVQPLPLNQIAHLAQMSAHQFNVPIRTAPPIITGLENFTPEQQAQIKAQLGSQLGTPITTTATLPASTSQYSSSQLAIQPTQSLNSNEYMQSHDKSNPQPASSNYSPQLMYRAQYTKG